MALGDTLSQTELLAPAGSPHKPPGPVSWGLACRVVLMIWGPCAVSLEVCRKAEGEVGTGQALPLTFPVA